MAWYDDYPTDAEGNIIYWDGNNGGPQDRASRERRAAEAAAEQKKPYTRAAQLFDAVLYEAQYNESPALSERLFQLAARLVPFLK